MISPIALTRQPSPALGQCELTFRSRVAIDVALACAQHLAYERALARLGCQVVSLPAEPDLPDSVFVEDTAVVLDEVAIITRPGAESRRPETHSVAAFLQSYRELRFIQPPGTLDGGDVLRLGASLYVGLSRRSNRAGIEQLAAAVAPFGCHARPVPVDECLHLKSAVTQVGPDTLLVNPNWVDTGLFAGMNFLAVDPAEPGGANALLTGGRVIYPASCPRTRERLELRGIAVEAVQVSELEKAEGAVTCCSLIVTPPADERTW